jgi:serine/threonine-protein kinase
MRGKALNEAEVLLSQSRLRSHFSGSVYDDQITTGLVVSQRPEAGRVVKVGRIVNLFTSSGRRQVQVPNLLGRPYDQAAEVLVNTGLNVGSVSFDYVADMDSGLVLSQDPLPGASTEAGALINLAVSTSEAVVEPAAQEPAEVPKQDKKGGFWPW